MREIRGEKMVAETFSLPGWDNFQLTNTADGRVMVSKLVLLILTRELGEAELSHYYQISEILTLLAP